jgi:tetratricopeptide (TPR) repeat protein
LMECYATLPDGTRKWLIRIPNWDLNWQGVFRFKKAVFLPRGSTISMRYHYDNSADNIRNPNSPPARVVGGNEATQEMGHLWLQVLPAAEGDQRMALQEALVQQRLQKYPDDFSANYNMGDLLLSRGDAAGAISYFEKAAKADPGSVFAASDLGVALFTASKLPEAEEQFKRALTIDPAYTDARFDLASEEAASQQYESAASDFKRVLVEKPDHEKAREHLGQVYVLWGDQLAKGGKDDQAAARYREALTIRPDDVDLHIRLGMTFARMEQLHESQAEFETVLRLQPASTLARQAIDAIQKRMQRP